MQQTPQSLVREYLVDLQDRITSTVALVDGGRFIVDAWTKPRGETLQGNRLAELFCDHIALPSCSRQLDHYLNRLKSISFQAIVTTRAHAEYLDATGLCDADDQIVLI